METDGESSLREWRISCKVSCLEGGIVRLIQVGISLSSLMCSRVERR